MIDKNIHMAEHNYIFVHIPKTAGRSILSVLGVKFHCEHKTIADYCKELTEPVVRSRFKFTSVRNPWDRAVSWWAFFGSMGPNREDFEPWLAKMQKRKNRLPHQKFPLDQMSFCRTESGEILMDHFVRFENLEADFAPIAKRFGIPAVLPKVGKQDRAMQIRMREAMLRSKHPEHAPLLATEDYHEMYKSRESIEIVAKLDAETIKRFGYKFQ